MTSISNKFICKENLCIVVIADCNDKKWKKKPAKLPAKVL